MCLRFFALLLSAALAATLANCVQAADAETALADELTLKTVGLATDGPGLLAFFRKRSQEQTDAAKLARLVAQLGAKAPPVREQAAAELVCVGPAAVPLLRAAAKDPDAVESASLARRCLQALEGDQSSTIPSAAARLLALRRPPGAIDVLLAYLPFADNTNVLDDVKETLSALAYHKGKPDAVLVRALGDPLSIRRATAIDVLCEAGTAEPRAALCQLLDDPKPLVRMRAALALANAREAGAVTTMIRLLADLPPAYGKQVEEYLIDLAGEQAPKVPLGTDQSTREKCRAAWEKWWQAPQGPELVAEFKKRTLTDADRQKVMALALKLGDEDFAVRQKAQADLLKLGPAAVSILRQVVNNPDPEIRDRANKLLTQIGKGEGAPLSPVTARLIAFRKPEGAAEALLAYLPLATEGTMQDEVQAALNAVAYRDGKPDPAMLKALHDRSPLRREATAEALCQRGVAYPQAAVRVLLKDSNAEVRLKAALALASVCDREAVPVLIAAIGDLPGDQSAPAEEYLLRLAGDQGPPDVPGSDEAARHKRRDAWASWWQQHGATVELVAMSRTSSYRHYYGYTLIVLNQNGIVMELDKNGKQRWQLNGLANPMDAQVLPGNRVLLAEYNGGRVTERNLKNEIVWQKAIAWPISCRRLPNGNTQIVTRNQLIEVNRHGKEVFALNRNFNDIMAARRLRNGQIVVASSQGMCFRFDSRGKELGSFRLLNVNTYGIDILPNGHVLLPTLWNNRVIEYDAEGKEVWGATMQQVSCATRAPNGSTMVATQVWPAVVYELDKKGNRIWEHRTLSIPVRVKRR